MIYLFKCITCFESSGTSSTAHTPHTHRHIQTHNGIEQKTKFGFYITISVESSTSSNGSSGDGIVSYWHSRAPNKLKNAPYLFSLTELHSEVHCVLFHSLAFSTFESDWDFGATTNQPFNHHPKNKMRKKTSCNQILLLVLAEKIGKTKRRKKRGMIREKKENRMSTSCISSGISPPILATQAATAREPIEASDIINVAHTKHTLTRRLQCLIHIFFYCVLYTIFTRHSCGAHPTYTYR